MKWDISCCITSIQQGWCKAYHHQPPIVDGCQLRHAQSNAGLLQFYSLIWILRSFFTSYKKIMRDSRLIIFYFFMSTSTKEGIPMFHSIFSSSWSTSPFFSSRIWVSPSPQVGLPTLSLALEFELAPLLHATISP